VTADRLGTARAALEALRAAERADPRIDPRNGTAWWLPDARAPRAVVLLHGLSNGPLQYQRLAPRLHARGHAVIVPRFPHHGYRDRMTGALAQLRAREMEATALRAVALAALCGEQVALAGISIGATLGGWLAARVALHLAVAVAPFCGIRALPGPLNDGLGALLRAAPNAFAWWDPRAKQALPPAHGYPRFATRSIGESLELSTAIDAPPLGPPHARRVALVLNGHDPAVNNAHARRRFRTLRERGVALDEIVWSDVPHVHDLVEPEIPQARTDLVYPRLIELLES
jgi:dienelactone hydrolase